MTDRELLERAARTIGLTLVWSTEPDMPPRRADTYDYWTPLTDDGDAFRLMVKLQMTVEADEHPRATIPWQESAWAPFPLVEDADATVRRCIVLAAAMLPGTTQ
jgi:hypothetical protein